MPKTETAEGRAQVRGDNESGESLSLDYAQRVGRIHHSLPLDNPGNPSTTLLPPFYDPPEHPPANQGDIGLDFPPPRGQ
jgi:hypothetical protein